MCLSEPTSVRLSKEQVVEVCAGGYRTGVCSNDWDDTDASVVCRQLSQGDNGGMMFILALACAYNYCDSMLSHRC